MTLPTSGVLSLNDIQTEFGGANPIGINEYYAGGTYVPAGTTGTNGAVPSSGTIAISNFYGTSSYYTLSRSLRIRLSASAYLTRTFSNVQTDSRKITVSFWMKRGSTIGSSTNQTIITGYNGTSAGASQISIANDVLTWGFGNNAAGNDAALTTTQVFRDPSAWYHIVCVGDSTQATASNRMSMYVNGVQVTTFSTNNPPNLNLACQIGVNTANNRIGCRWNLGSEFFDGYLAEMYVIDGQQLTPSSFGAFNSTSGVWQPAKYTGTYGTNGFYLPFTNTTSTTTLVADSSGNGNNWTPNNISLTAGTTYDSMTDVPTLTSATAANYCVANPVSAIGAISTTNGNLTYSVDGTMPSTFAVSSGKWYWEYTALGIDLSFGVADISASGGQYSESTSPIYGYRNNATKQSGTYASKTAVAYGATFTTNDVIGTALDLDSGTITFYKNGVSQGVAYTGLSGLFTPMPWQNGSAGATSCAVNFGQQPFIYTPPTGFLTLNTFNLPTPTIIQSYTEMDATIYTGTGVARSITNAAAFKPDLVWIKSRSAATDHKLTDSVRGVTKAIVSNSTAAETTDTNGLTAFNTNGFSLGTDTIYNNNTATYVAWQWQAGQGTNTSNTNGTITSTVSLNATAGFSVVTYTSTTATSATIGHGLGVAPSMIIARVRNGTNNSWAVYHKSLGNANWIFLNSTAASGTASGAWNTTDPTSSVFSVAVGGSTGNNWTNTAGYNYVAYCWAEIAGFSEFGSYTGNGSTDGPFVYTGFRPKYVMIKRTDAANNWEIMDTTRNTYNQINTNLYADSSAAEVTNAAESLDILSNGFKCRGIDSTINTSGGNYIYMAFAENPFKYALAR